MYKADLCAFLDIHSLSVPYVFRRSSPVISWSPSNSVLKNQFFLFSSRHLAFCFCTTMNLHNTLTLVSVSES